MSYLGARRPFVLIGACALALNAYGQDPESSPQSANAAVEPPRDGESAELAAQKESIAESILAREEAASGRPFDPGFRAQVKKGLASLSMTALEAQTQRSGLGPQTKSLGESQVDLVYTPVTPCRIIDTRLAGGVLGAGTTRSFLVTGTDLSSQGGSATGCNIPSLSTAAMINFVAVSPAGAGHLRATPFGTPIPLAAILNYAAGLNIANGLAVTICDPATTTCTFDFTIQANGSATDLVADVQGYFRSVTTEGLWVGTASNVPIPPTGATPILVAGVSFTPKAFGQVLVRARGHCSVGPAGASTDDAIELAIGEDATQAFSTSANQWGILRIPVNSGAHRLMFSAERIWPAARGFTYFLGLFARHAVGSVPDVCSGTVVVERNL
jgi:hypothetical protein